MRVIRRAIVMLVLLPGLAHAETLTLTQVVQKVRATHPAIEQSRWDVKAAQAGRSAAGWLPNPEMGVMFEEMPLRAPSLGNADMTTYSVSQEIPFPTKLITKIKAAGYEVRAKQALVTGSLRERSFEAKQGYFELVAVQKQIGAVSTMIGYYDRMLGSLESSYGSVSQKQQAQMADPMADTSAASDLTDIYMVKMKRVELQTQLHDLHHKQASLTAKLNLMMGREPEMQLRLVDPPAPKLKWSIATLEDRLGENSDLQAMSALVAKAKTETRLAKQTYLPDLMPEVAYNQRQGRENAYSLSLKLNVPLWFPKNAAEVRQASALQKRAEKEYETQKLNARSDLHYLWEHARWHSQILQKYRGEILPFARSAVNTSLSDYQINRQAILAASTLNSLINYHQAQVMYWELWQDYMTEYAMLERLVGDDFSKEAP